MHHVADLQKQLRQAADDFYQQIIALTQALSDLEDTKPPLPAQYGLNFARLAREGKQNPICSHPLEGRPKAEKEIYLTALCALAQTVPEAEDAWLLIQRIALRLKISPLEQLAASAARIDEDALDRLALYLINDQLNASFLLDAMLVCLCCGEACPRTVEALEKLALLTALPEKKVAFLIELAEILARQDADAYLDLGLMLSEWSWLGLGYIQKNGDILYTNDFEAAKRHDLHRVILHDCVIDGKSLGEIEWKNCVLLDCSLEEFSHVTFDHCVLINASFSFTYQRRTVLTGSDLERVFFKSSKLKNCGGKCSVYPRSGRTLISSKGKLTRGKVFRTQRTSLQGLGWNPPTQI